LPHPEEPPAAVEVKTAELPRAEASEGADERLAAVGLEVTTATTRPLSPEVLEHSQRKSSEETQLPIEAKMDEYSASAARADSFEDFDDALLDLGHFEPAHVSSEDAILEIDLGISAPAGYSAAAAVAAQPAPVESRPEAAWTPPTEEHQAWG